MSTYRGVNACLAWCLNSRHFQPGEGAFSVIVKTDGSFTALVMTTYANPPASLQSGGVPHVHDAPAAGRGLQGRRLRVCRVTIN